MKKSTIHTLGLLTSTLIFCNNVSAITLADIDQAFAAENANSTQSYSAPNDNWVRLGRGIYSPTGLPAPQVCMKDTKLNNQLSNGIGHVSLSDQVSKSQLIRYFNLSVGGNVGWSIFSANASSNYIATTEDNNYSRNFTYLQDFSWTASFDPQEFDIENLTKAGQLAYKAGGTKFLNYCGDSFVRTASAGVLLSTNVRINFKTHKDEQTFNSHFNAKVGLGSLTNEIKRNSTLNTMNASITVSAIQVGGMPDKLSSIFKLGQDGYYAASCSFSRLSDCDQLLNGIINYANTLSSQVRDTKGNILTENLAYFNPEVDKYSDHGIDIEVPKVSKEVLTASNQLQDLYRKTKEQLIFVEHYKTSAVASHFDSGMVNFLNSARNALTNRLNYILTYGLDCYTSAKMATCPTIVSDMNSTFNNMSYYQVSQDSLEYIMRGWGVLNSNGREGHTAYHYPVNLSGKYYWSTSHGRIGMSIMVVVNKNLVSVLYDHGAFLKPVKQVDDTYIGFLGDSRLVYTSIPNPA